MLNLAEKTRKAGGGATETHSGYIWLSRERHRERQRERCVFMYI